MRFLIGLACVCIALQAQTADTPAMAQARVEVERIRELVDAGALPRTRLTEAEIAIADLKDDDVLRRTLYGAVTVEDLTEDQTSDMLAAAKRQLERRQKRLESAKALVNQGVAAPTSLYPLLEELDRGKRTVDLAESRARVFQELAEAARAEEELAAAMEREKEESRRMAERFDGSGVFSEAQFKRLTQAYEMEFSKPLPITARGETAFHRSLGFDHRGRVDVGLHPDQKEGAWLRHFLEVEGIPYFAFRQAVPGKATAAHIHIGPPSTRLRAAD